VLLYYMPVPVAARSKAWAYGPSFGRIVGLEYRRRHGNLSVVNIVCHADRVPCFELIIRPEETYIIWSV
jgi:hypothetical protein